MEPTTTPLALVTGAARGIGEAIVRRLLTDGLCVIALDQDAEALAALAADLPQTPLSTCPFDLTDIQGTPALLQQLVAQHGPITRLALNAGVWPGAPITTMSDATWDLNFSVNVTSPFAFIARFGPGHGGGWRWCHRLHR